MIKIAVIDYGMGNLRSVVNSLVAAEKSAQHRAQIVLTSDPDEIVRADKVVFPGQGAMGDCMKSLAQSGLRTALMESLKTKPFFGICVGAQLLFKHSEEGNTQGLGFFEGEVKKFTVQKPLKIPHMGWNIVHYTQHHPVLKKIPNHSHFYFVHSYYFAPADQNIVLGESEYPNRFACIVGQENVFATQFHAEKSHNNGLILLTNFIDWDGTA